MHQSPTSLPQGEAKCRPCRQAARPPKPKVPGYGTKSWRDCEVCGHRYRAKMKEQRTCGRTCGTELKRRARSLVPAIQKPERILVTAISHCDCAGCGRPFVTRASKRRRFCTRDCLDTYASKRVISSRRVQIACSGCDSRFEALVTTNSPRICEDCKAARLKARRVIDRKQRDPSVTGNHRRRARHFGVEYEPVNHKRVFERDQWKCGICKRKVKPTTKHPHPRSATLDHVLPLSRGGGHTYANVQLACFECNSRKGAGGGQQLALCG